MSEVADERRHNDNRCLRDERLDVAELDQDRQQKRIHDERDDVDSGEANQVDENVPGAGNAECEAAMQNECDSDGDDIRDVQRPEIADEAAGGEIEQRVQTIADSGVDPADENEANSLVAEQNRHSS